MQLPSAPQLPCPLQTRPRLSTGQSRVGRCEQLAPLQPSAQAQVPCTQRPRPAETWQWCGHASSSQAAPRYPSWHWQRPRTHAPWPEQSLTRQPSSSPQADPIQPRLQKQTPLPASQKPPSGYEQLDGHATGRAPSVRAPEASRAPLALLRRLCSSRSLEGEKISCDGASMMLSDMSGERARMDGGASSMDSAAALETLLPPTTRIGACGRACFFSFLKRQVWPAP